MRFTLPEDVQRALRREPVALPVALVVGHGDYRHRTEVSPETRQALLEDLGLAAPEEGGR